MACNCKDKPAPYRGKVQFCEHCDSCAEADSNVRLCAFVVPTLEEGRYYRNSFVFVEDENTTYYIDGHRGEIPFGTRPLYINDFDPDDPAHTYRQALVYDIKNSLLYIYDVKGEMLKVPLGKADINLQEGKGIVITVDGDEYTIAVDDTIATQDDLDAEAKTRQLEDGRVEMELTKAISDESARLSAQVDNEAQARTAADQGLQSQIDAIVNSSDVKDVVGTKAELEAYDTSTLGQNDIIKVLQDESEDNATTYYRWDGTKFDLVGEIGPYYTKGEIGNQIVVSLATSTANKNSTNVRCNIKDLTTGRVTTDYMPLSVVDSTQAGVLKADDYTKFSDAAAQTETNTQDISEALGQIAALDADKLGIESLLEGSGITITKEGEGRETKLTISAEGGGSGVKHLTAADRDYQGTGPQGVKMWDKEPGVYVLDTYLTIYFCASTYTNMTMGSSIIVTSTGTYTTCVYYDTGSSGDANTLKLATAHQSDGEAYGSVGRAILNVQDIVDNLTTTAPGKVLSAAQGKKLREMIEALPSGGGGVTTLTTADYGYPEESPRQVAAWLLEPGVYVSGENGLVIGGSTGGTATLQQGDSVLIMRSSTSKCTYMMCYIDNAASNGATVYAMRTSDGGGQGQQKLLVNYDVVNNLSSDSGTKPLSAYQGLILDAKIGKDLTKLVTQAKGDLISAINEVAGKEGGGVEVTQEPGGSTTSVMSQDAATKLIYTNTTNRESVKIGDGANGGVDSLRSVTIGKDAATTNNRGTALGTGTMVSGDYAVALGAGSTATAQGELSVGGNGLGTNGYGGTNTRLITNVHDPVNAQDAATKAYVDAHGSPLEIVKGVFSDPTDQNRGIALTTGSQISGNYFLQHNGNDVTVTFPGTGNGATWWIIVPIVAAQFNVAGNMYIYDTGFSSVQTPLFFTADKANAGYMAVFTRRSTDLQIRYTYSAEASGSGVELGTPFAIRVNK